MMDTKSWSIGDTESLFRALGDIQRIRILILLAAEELYVCELSRLLELPQPTLSNHLALLKRAGLVVSEARGRWRLYRLGQIPGPVSKILADLLEDETVQRDMENLRKYLEEGRDLCGTKAGEEA